MAIIGTLSIFTWLCFWGTSLGAIRHSLKPGDVLDHSSILNSANDKFWLKFDTLDSYTSFTYLVISHSNTGYKDWIANRNDPIENNSGVLTLEYSGALTITRQNGMPIILYSPFQSQLINNTILTLPDSGNLVLQELQPNGVTKHVLWRSFDHPSAILLPGMKLGVNHRTGQSWSVTASVSNADPASGSFTLEWEPRKSQLIIKRQGQIYWASGLGKNERFVNIPKEVQQFYEYNIVANEEEESFSYTSHNGESQWVLYYNGQLLDTRGNDTFVARVDTCYGYNSDGGCQKWEHPKCRNPGDTFKIKSGYIDHASMSGGSVAIDTNISLGESDCKATCWANCTCFGFKTYFPNGTGCNYYHGSWKIAHFIFANVNINILEPYDPTHKDIKKWIKVGSAMAATLIIICLGIFSLRRRRKTGEVQGHERSKEENELLNLVSLDRYTAVNELPNAVKKVTDLKVFSYALIMAATNRFSQENMLEKGALDLYIRDYCQREKK